MANFIIWSGIDIHHTPIRTGGPYQIASWLRQNGYTVQVIDFCYLLTEKQIIEITEKYINSTTVAIGVSSTFWELNVIKRDNIKVAEVMEPEWLKNCRDHIQVKYPKLDWILGGANSKAYSTFNWIRFEGHAEDNILKYLQEKIKTSNLLLNFDIKNNIKKHVDNDFLTEDEVIAIELGRGCIFKCKFCSYPLIGKKPGSYIRTYQDIKDELLYNYERWGITKYYFTDDTVNDDHNKVQALAEISQSLPFNIEWTGFLRADLIWSNPQTIELLEISGLKSAFFGIESFNPYSSKIIGKGWSGKHAKNFLPILKEKWGNRINWHLGLILGLPEWSYKELEEDMKWLVDNQMHRWWWWALYINPVSGKMWQSEFDLNYKKYGYTFPDNNLINWEYKDIKHEEVRLAALEANDKCLSKINVGSWLLGELSTTYKTSMSNLLHLKQSEVNFEDARLKTKHFVEDYYNKHVSIY